jgi:hypothetical protein
MFPEFILIKVRGRLGNQLFQIAFAKAMGKRLNCFVIFDIDHQFVWDDYFRARAHFRLLNKVISTVFKKIFIRKKYFEPLTITNDRLADLSSISFPNTVYQGYFQSPHYFSNLSVEDDMFKIRPEILEKFRLKYNSLLQEKGIVFVHIRRTDYVNVRKVQLNNSEITLPAEYYNTCLASLADDKRKRIIVLSDDMEWVKRNIKWAAEFIHNTDLIFDFLLMMHAETLIISNSTFAWWAAYLNTNSKNIYAPKYFLGYNASIEYPTGIMKGTSFQWVRHH